MAFGAFKPSRIIAVGVIIAATVWIASGVVSGEPSGGEGGGAGGETTVPVQKVGVTTATPEMHRRDITLSCVTQADHKAAAVARGAGVITSLEVNRGDIVGAGDMIGKISDEGRQAAVDQALGRPAPAHLAQALWDQTATLLRQRRDWDRDHQVTPPPPAACLPCAVAVDQWIRKVRV